MSCATIRDPERVRRFVADGWSLEPPVSSEGHAELHKPGERHHVVARGVWLHLKRLAALELGATEGGGS